jgi:hypothetical protein
MQAVCEKMVVMDVYTPANSVLDLVAYLRFSTPLTTPVWLCPIAPPLSRQLLSPHGQASSLLINVGIYGRVSDNKGEACMRRLEKWILREKDAKKSEHKY